MDLGLMTSSDGIMNSTKPPGATTTYNLQGSSEMLRNRLTGQRSTTLSNRRGADLDQ
jgi:hypothetical protein